MTTHLFRLFGVLAIAMAACGPASAVKLELVPVTPIISSGGTTAVMLNISELGSSTGPSVGTFDVDIFFDPAVLSLIGTAFGDPILGNQLDVFGLGTLAIATPGAGSVNMFELSFDQASELDGFQASGFTLATLTFRALRAGTSPLDMSINALGDGAGDQLPATTGASAVIVTATAVPEPASLSMVVLGLCLCWCLQKTARRHHSRGRREGLQP